MKNLSLCAAACPVARSLGHVGDSWAIMILRDAFAGLTRFDEFQKSCGMAPNILSKRLKELVEDGMLDKVCYTSTPPRYEYHLTKKGRDFRPVILALAEWGSLHFSPEGRQLQLVENKTNRPVRAVMVDADTGELITSEAYSMVPGPAADAVIRYRHDYLEKKKAGTEPLKFAPPQQKG